MPNEEKDPQDDKEKKRFSVLEYAGLDYDPQRHTRILTILGGIFMAGLGSVFFAPLNATAMPSILVFCLGTALCVIGGISIKMEVEELGFKYQAVLLWFLAVPFTISVFSVLLMSPKPGGNLRWVPGGPALTCAMAIFASIRAFGGQAAVNKKILRYLHYVVFVILLLAELVAWFCLLRRT